MNNIAIKSLNTLATSVLLCLNFTAQAQYNPNGSYQGNASPDFQTSAAGAAAAASAAANSGMNAANNAANSAVNNAAASYQQNASAQFLQSSAPASSFGQSGTGYTNDGTLMMGGQKIGNPHQALHDLNVPSFFGVNADRLSNSVDPSYGQGTLAQMENHTLTIGVPAGNVILSRLYLTPTNPYTEGVATPHNNFQTYQAVVAGAQAGSYQLTVANDNKLYAFKTLGTLNTQSQNILIKELPAHSVFIANSDPKGGAVAVRVTQSGDYAAMQNYLATVKPYDFSWRSAMGAWADGTARPDNVSERMGQYASLPIASNDAGAAFFGWVMGSKQVQQYSNDLQTKSQVTGNENFGVLAWDANQNRYVMLDPTNMQATAGSVSGNMPTLGAGQTAFFGIHTHPEDSTPSNQDILQTNRLGLDQVIIGNSSASAVFTNNPNNTWQGQNFLYENATHDSISGSGYGTNNGGTDTTGVGGVANGQGGQVGGNSGNRASAADGQRLTNGFRSASTSCCSSTDKIQAYLKGVWSVATGNYNLVRAVGRESGILGEDEKNKIDQEGTAVNSFVNLYYENKEFRELVNKDAAEQGAELLLTPDELKKWYLAGRISAGVLTGLGPTAAVGDFVTAVENGRSIVDSIIRGGIGGR